MTQTPPAFRHLGDRLVHQGYIWNVAVATFEDPNHYSAGVKFVLVNGKTAVRDGKITSERAGLALRGPGYGKR